MKIINLMEDTAGNTLCLFEHGLSFYIETKHHKLLLDTGASDAFLQNARRLGIDLAQVDTVVISHGHYDHTGGLVAFTELNPKAVVYIHRRAVGDYYNCRHTPPKYIGMDARIASLPQVVWTDGNLIIDEELSLFTGVTGRHLYPRGNRVLMKKVGDTFVEDPFDHEQYLVVTEGETRVLLSGCAHNGIVNILEEYRRIYGSAPTYVISGFHTTMPAYTHEDEENIRAIAAYLDALPTVFFSGHCTGAYPLSLLRRSMRKNRLYAIHSGDPLLTQ